MRYVCILVAALCMPLSVWAQEEAAPLPKPEVLPESAEPRHVRVLWMENPSSQAVISWSTTLQSSPNRLHYDTEPRNGNLGQYARRVDNVHSGEYTRTEDDYAYGTRPLHYHHAFIDGLEPDTTYYFVAESAGSVSREFHFVTAPDDGRTIRVLFGGDSRIGGRDPYLHEDRRGINRRMAALAEAHEDVIAFCHGGDFYQRAELRYMEPWLTDHELTVTDEGRSIPIIPARGNHDMAIGFEEMFWWPDRQHDYYYVTQLSEDVALITLNSEISLAGDQRVWLEATLEEARPDNRWLFVQYHKPAYSSVRGWTDGEDRRHYWVPLFEKYDVDLVCESHDHALKRTLPIREGGPHPNGITYIGDGGLGVPQRTPDPTRWYLQAPGITDSVHHVHLLEFEPDQIRGRAFGMDAELLDDFALAPNQALAEVASAE
jgi:acid phosphatase type 7